MAYLEEYKSLDEKSQFFQSEQGMICGNIENIFIKLEDLNSNNNYLFRGINNAKHKLYSSAQREFLTRELYAITKHSAYEKKYNEWISHLLDEIKEWNNKSLQNYFESIGIEINSNIAYLSFMQHYGLPTPLLDFTHDPFIALFFAIQDAQYYSGNNNIESCISLYYINKTNNINKVLNVDSGIKSKTYKPEITYSDFLEKNAISIIENNSKNYKVTNNLNIVNQKGCFVFNWHSINPLEIAYADLIAQLNEGLKNLDIKIEEEKIHCLNIHKSLIPKIRHELFKRKGIYDRYIYPNIQLEKENLINNSIIKLTTF